MDYKPTIGLEIHTELKTETKMFCRCVNDPDEKTPNKNICPVCTAHPGTLPVINVKAVEAVLKLGLVLGCENPAISKFDRKNYFYPDLPKGYQISQYDQPFCLGGNLQIPNGKSVRLTRIHLEEDTGRLVHADEKVSLVDFNRAGVPLMELVTEPDIETGEEAAAFAKELQLIMRYLGISDADMEKGHMRIEANISVSKDENLGTKVEVKNLNSFRAVSEAIDYEISRQSRELEAGEKIKQETRGWNEVKKQTVSQRSKEEAHDYRYFPEPDLPPLEMKAFDLEKLRLEIPELPASKRERFAKEYSLSYEQAKVLIEDPAVADFFEEAASEFKNFLPSGNFNSLYNYYVSDAFGAMKAAAVSVEQFKIKVSPEHFAHLIYLLESGKLTSRMAKDVLKEMFEKGTDPEQIIKEKGFHEVVGEDELGAVVDEISRENEKVAADYKAGKDSALQFLIGQAMRKLQGRADPLVLARLFKDKLK